MKKAISICVICVMAVLTVHAQQSKNENLTKLSIGAEVGLPSGDLSNGWNTGFGASLKSAFPLATDVALTTSAGYISFGGKSILGSTMPAWNMIPVKAGLRYSVGGSAFNIEPQLGYTFGSVTGVPSNNASGFTWAFGAGYFFTPAIDLGVRYESFKSSGSSSSANFIGLRLAYNFSLGGK